MKNGPVFLGEATNTMAVCPKEEPARIGGKRAGNRKIKKLRPKKKVRLLLQNDACRPMHFTHECFHFQLGIGALITMHLKLALILMTCFLILTGCAAPVAVWSSDPLRDQAENPFYVASITPEKDSSGLYVKFHLEVLNRSKVNLEIDWSESRYLFKGKEYGPLVFTGVDPQQVKAGNVPKDQIAPGETFVKDIGPLRLISFSPNRNKSADTNESKISFGPLPEGHNGIQLVIRSLEHAIVEDLQTRLSNQ